MAGRRACFEMRSFAQNLARSLAAAGLLLGTAALGSGCSLGNIAVDACTTDASCQAAFGLGSSCQDGWCSEPPICQNGHDCRRRFGGGACLASMCVDRLPEPSETGSSASCPSELREPTSVGSGALTGPDAPLVIGALYAFDDPFDAAQGKAAALAVREINNAGGLNNGRKLMMVACDVGGPGATANSTEREQLNQISVDYLAGTLGVPAVVGPFTSTDALAAVTHTVAGLYPTVLVSPSATSKSLSDQPDRLNPSDPYGLFWRTCSSDELQGKVLAENVVPPDVNVALVYVSNTYGQGLVNVFQQYRASGTETLFPFDGQTDMATLASSVAQANPPPAGVLVIAAAAADTIAVLTALSTTSVVATPFYFTDGSKDAATLLDPSLPQGVQDMILGAHGTAAAAPSGPAYDQFRAQLQQAFQVNADDFGFMANTYDAGWVVGCGLVFATNQSAAYDGLNVAEGLAHLSAGISVQLGPTTWPSAKSGLSSGDLTIDIAGTSGPLDFDPTTGEAPGPIEIWSVGADFQGFVQDQVIQP
jgi:ABC-type branched-subunit amino acid transport system substrate-binding protein